MASGRLPFGNQKLIYLLIHLTKEYPQTLRIIYEVIITRRVKIGLTRLERKLKLASLFLFKFYI